MQSNVPAILTLRGVAKMTDKQRRILAIWLRQHAEDLVREGALYAQIFRGRFVGRP